jgi:anti-sigma-K factor RskA
MNQGEHTLELSAGYALGALSPEERQFVEHHVAECPSCAEDLAQMHSVADVLPLAAEPAAVPMGLKKKILSAVRGDAAAERFLREQPRSPARQRPSVVFDRFAANRWMAAVAAAAVIVAAGALTGVFGERNAMNAQMAQMQQQIAVAERGQAALRSEIAEREHVLAALAQGRVWDMSSGPRSHWWHCTVVQPPKNARAMLIADAPPAPKGMAYQAWIIRHGRPHSAGMVPPGRTSSMTMPMPVQSGDVVAFTIEPAQGSNVPTMPPVMAHTLD